MDRYKKTFETWNKVAFLYQEKFMELALYNDTYDAFCSSIETINPAILELGCGPGNITRYLLSNRPDFKILAIDVAPNMIELAKLNNPAADFKVMDCRTIDKLSGKFEGIIGGFCIPYLSKEDCCKLLRDCYHLLNKNGCLYLSMMEGNYLKSGFKTGSTGDQAYIYYHTEVYFRNALIKNKFELQHFIRIAHSKNDGSKQPELVFIAKKP
jgi:2-polyprenyl-3-methyl-5-hydroxy-6-metoxy-1,4-benzoquinol methylase